MSSEALPSDPWVGAWSFFNESRDFLLAWEILTTGAPQGEAKERVRWPVRAPVTCGCMALELALKALVTLDGGTPKSVHWAEVLFRQMLPSTQQELAAMLQIGGKTATPASVLRVLRTFDDGAPESGKRVSPLEAWRYSHEHTTVQDAADVMYAVTRAIHDLIVRRRPDFGPWPGIIGG